MNKVALGAIGALACSAITHAATNQVDTHTWEITEGVAFTLNNEGATSFLFNWSDASGNFVDVADPTIILTAGETYTFQRLPPARPFVITDTTLPVDGTDGNFFRTTSDGAVIDAATLDPISDFTADPGPTADFISWTPTEGEYFYTCRVTGHTGMTGRILVVPAPGTAATLATVGLLGLRRRR